MTWAKQHFKRFSRFLFTFYCDLRESCENNTKIPPLPFTHVRTHWRFTTSAQSSPLPVCAPASHPVCWAGSIWACPSVRPCLHPPEPGTVGSHPCTQVRPAPQHPLPLPTPCSPTEAAVATVCHTCLPPLSSEKVDTMRSLSVWCLLLVYWALSVLWNCHLKKFLCFWNHVVFLTLTKFPLARPLFGIPRNRKTPPTVSFSARLTLVCAKLY